MKTKLIVALVMIFSLGTISCSEDFDETKKLYIDAPGDDQEVEEKPGGNG